MKDIRDDTRFLGEICHYGNYAFFYTTKGLSCKDCAIDGTIACGRSCCTAITKNGYINTTFKRLNRRRIV